MSRRAALVWHYSVGMCLREIIRSGTLLPATAFVPEQEAPVLWFSSRQTYEPTARKMLMTSDGKVRSLSIKETAAHCGGLVRFGVDVGLTMPWSRLRVAAGIRRYEARLLERTARRDGADPDQWHGIIGPLALAFVETIEVDLTGSGHWVSTETTEAAEPSLLHRSAPGSGDSLTLCRARVESLVT